MVCIIWDRTEREDVDRVWTSEKQSQEPSYEGRDMSPHFITAAIVQLFLLQLSVPAQVPQKSWQWLPSPGEQSSGR